MLRQITHAAIAPNKESITRDRIVIRAEDPKELQKRNPDTEYTIVVGADSFKIMPKWYLGEEILKEFKVIVYPRKGYRVKTMCRRYKALYLEDAPLNNISSTQIRNGEL